MGFNAIRFQADGFLVLADGLVDLAFLLEGGAEVIVRDVIVLRDCKRMPEEGLTVLPITELLPRQRQAQDDRRCPPTDNAITWYRQPRVSSHAPQTASSSTPMDGK